MSEERGAEAMSERQGGGDPAEQRAGAERPGGAKRSQERKR
jgi:hypothetical protein